MADPKIGARHRQQISAKSSLPIFGSVGMKTFAGSTTVRATSSTTFDCSSWLIRTLKMSRISTAISTSKAEAMPAQMARIRSRICARTLSENLGY